MRAEQFSNTGAVTHQPVDLERIRAAVVEILPAQNGPHDNEGSACDPRLFNSITDGGVATLVEVLPQCPALTYLRLPKNEITHAGAAGQCFNVSMSQCFNVSRGGGGTRMYK